MYLIKNISTRLEHHPDLAKVIAHKFQIEESDFRIVNITRRSIDSRKRNNVWLNYTVEAKFATTPPLHHDIVEVHPKAEKPVEPIYLSDQNPIIIGCGPSSLFAGLALVEQGFAPHFMEQGERIVARDDKVNYLWLHNQLDPDSNVQFGEGGAGAYSDGKLTARNRDHYSAKVYDYLIKFGGNKRIAIDALPHLGTDGIKAITTKLISYLEDKGAVFHFSHKLTEIKSGGDKLELIINGNSYQPEICLLGVGNSSRELFTSMYNNKIALEAKSFAMGVRIEHKQEFINNTFYGEKCDFNVTGPATYRLTAKAGGHSVYSFCMCPGGSVICGSSEPGGIVTNGMSFTARDGVYGNSAIVATIEPRHFGDGVLDGMHLQQQIEQKAFRQFYEAPAQSGRDFIRNRVTAKLPKSTYRPGVYSRSMGELFPLTITKALVTGLKHFNKMYRGFTDNGLLIGPETRTSSPVRIVRDHQTGESVSTKGLYPIGEGAGYAGGIISSAVDGFKVATKFRMKK